MTDTHAAYLRISKSDDRSTSLDKQRANARARSVEIDPNARFVTFEDDGVSGQRRTRAGFDALLAGIRERRFSHVLIDTLDRLTRDRGAVAMWDLAAACEDTGTALVGVSQAIDLSSSSGELSASIMAAAARYEARRTADRQRATYAHRRREGKRATSAPAPYGLRWATVETPTGTRKLDRLEEHPENGPRVRAAIEGILAGTATMNSTVTSWNRAGVPTPQGAPKWTNATISRVLRNPALCGMIGTSVGGERDVLRGDDGLPIVREGEGVVTVEEWHALQSALDARRWTRQAANAGPLPLLHGLLVDADGVRLYLNRGKREERYSTKSSTGSQVTVGRAVIEALVVEEVLARVGHLDEVREELVTPARDSARLAAVRGDIARALAALASPSADVLTVAARLQSLRALEAELLEESTAATLRLVPTGRTIGQALAAALEDGDTDTAREILAGPLGRVVILPGRPGRHGLDPERVKFAWKGDDWLAGQLD